MMMRKALILVCLVIYPLHAALAQEEEPSVWETIWAMIFGANEKSDKQQNSEEPSREGALPSTLQIGDWPVVSFAQDHAAVREDIGEIVVPVTKSLSNGRRVSVRYRLEPSTALANNVFDLGNGLLAFEDGEQSKDIRLKLLDDDVYAPGQTLRITLTDAIGTEIGTSVIVIDVTENDRKPEPKSAPGELSALPVAVDFGEIKSGLRAERSVKITNVGQSSIYLNRVDETADNISISASNCVGTTLLQNTSCSVDLSYQAGLVPVDGELLVTGETNNGVINQALVISVPLSARVLPEKKKNSATLDAREELIQRIIAERNQAMPSTISTVEIPAPEGPKKYRMSQEDISDENSPGRRVFDYPVDLSRVITTIQEIPCVTQKTINTQLEGTISCKIESPVMGFHAVRHGKALVLLEPETWAEGDYTTLDQQGDTRINVAWKRFLRPDGSSLYLSNGFPAEDAMGRMGLHGPVDNHNFEKIVSPLLLSGIVATGTELLSVGDDYLNSASQQIMVDGTTRVVGEMLERNMDLRPIMTIPVRTRLLIKPTTDLYFKETEIVPFTDSEGVIAANDNLKEKDQGNQAASSGDSSSNGTRSLAAQATKY
jgi:hypothetical protein